jgi:hypothetical protein
MEEFAARQNGSIIIRSNDTGFIIIAVIPLASIDGKDSPAAIPILKSRSSI